MSIVKFMQSYTASFNDTVTNKRTEPTYVGGAQVLAAGTRGQVNIQ